MEIISILSAKGHVTMGELAWKFDVSRRTIMNDVIAETIIGQTGAFYLWCGLKTAWQAENGHEDDGASPM